MSDSLPEQLRPKMFGHLWGQSAHMIGDTLRKSIAANDYNRFILLQGDSGTGKTTVARIFGRAVNCDTRLKALEEGKPSNGEPCGACEICVSVSPGYIVDKNAADTRGIDDIREVISDMETPPWEGTYKVILLDEAHQLTKDAQNALLKATEPEAGTYEHIAVIMCSTEPNKIIKTLRKRFMEFEFKKLLYTDMLNCLQNLVYTNKDLQKHWKTGIMEVLEHVARVSEGSPRVALLTIEKLAKADALSDEAKACGLITEPEEVTAEIKQLAQALILRRRPWNEVSSITQKLLRANIQPEALRLAVAGYLRSSLIGANDPTNLSDALYSIVDPLMDNKPENKLFLQLAMVYRVLRR